MMPRLSVFLTALLAISASVPVAALAQEQDGAITGLSLSSPNPGELTITWDEATPTPTDYRVAWAESSESFRSYRDSEWNAFPTANSHTVTGLDEGTEYRAIVRSRYRGDDRRLLKSGPWSSEVSLMVSASPETTPEPLADPGDKGGTVHGRSAQSKTTSVTTRAPQPSKSFDLASSSNDDLDNDNPVGVSGWGDELWVINNNRDRRFRYRRSDGSGGTASSLPDSSHDDPTGMWVEGTTMWAADFDDTRLYAYSIAGNGNLSDRSDNADIDLTGSNDGPRGVTGHDGTVWVVDKDDTYVYAYDTTTRQRDEDHEFDLKGGNNDPWGIWIDGATAWVNDKDDNIIRAYDLTTSGAPLLPDRSIDLHRDNNDPHGMWSDGETLWVADNADSYMYAYDLDDSRKSSRDIDLHRDNDHPVRIAGDGLRIWVADSADTYAYGYFLEGGTRIGNTQEIDMTHSGHDAVDGMWVHGNLIWMLENHDKTLYTYGKLSAATTDDGFTVGLGSGVPLGGVWGDGTTIWLVTRFESRVFAYSIDGDTATDQNVRLTKQFFDIAGMWSDGTVVWVLDPGNVDHPATLSAHRLSDGNRVTALDVGLSPRNADPRGVYGHGDTIWVGDGDDTHLYAYEKPDYTEPSFSEGDFATRSVDEDGAENTRAGAPVTAEDPDGDPLTYSLSGADAAAFTVGTRSGQIRVGAGTSLDFETRQSYEVIVQVTDNRNANGQRDTRVDDTITVTIRVNNLDEPGSVTVKPPPVAGFASTAEVADPDGEVTTVTSWVWEVAATRNAVDWTAAVGAGAATDTYTPAVAETGMWLRVTAVYDDPVFAMAATVRAVAGPVGAANPQAAFVDVAENGGVGDGTADPVSFSVEENAAATTVVGTVAATDGDGDTLTYTVTGTDATAFGEAFALGANSGQITVKAGGVVDFETKPLFAVTVNVTDGEDADGQADTAVDDTVAVTINVTNLDEPGSVTVKPVPVAGFASTATVADPDGAGANVTSWVWEVAAARDADTWTAAAGAGAATDTYTPAVAETGMWLRVIAVYDDPVFTTAATVRAVAGPVAPGDVKVSFGAPAHTVAEGAGVTVTVGLDADPERTVTIALTATNVNSASDDDYSGVPASVTFNSGETSKTFTFTATQDSDDDDGERVRLAFDTLPSGVSEGTTGETVVFIADDDAPTIVTPPVRHDPWPPAPGQCSEGTAGTSGVVHGTISRSGEYAYFGVIQDPFVVLNVWIRGSPGPLGALPDPKLLGYRNYDDNFATGSTYGLHLTHSNGWKWYPATTSRPRLWCFAVASGDLGVGHFEVKVEVNTDPLFGGAPGGYVSDIPGDITTDARASLAIPSSHFIGDDNAPGDDVDWYGVSLEAGVEYRVTAVPLHDVAARHRLNSPIVTGVYDGSGTLMAGTSSGGGGPPAVSYFTPPSDGAYFVGISTDGTDPDGLYLLCVDEADQRSNCDP